MASDPATTDLLAALRDPNHAGHLNCAAADEIERLRGVLQDIAAVRYGIDMNDSIEEKCDYWSSLAASYRTAARKALQP